MMDPQHSGTIWSPAQPRRRAGLDTNTQVDVAVIGAGITGLTAARLLAESGMGVAVLEARFIGCGTTGGTTAHLTAVYDHDYALLEKRYGGETARLVARAMMESIDLVEGWSSDPGMACDFRRVPGYLYCENADDQEMVLNEGMAARRAGLDVEILASAPLPFATQGAFVVRNQARLHPLRYLAGLADQIERAGGRIYEDSRVVEVQDGSPCRLVLANGAVVTAREVIMATHTPIGRHLLHALLAPSRSFVLTAQVHGDFPDALFWDTADPYHYLRVQEAEGGLELLIGGEDRKTGSGADGVALAALERWARDRLELGPITAAWGAQLFDPADHLPYIGTSPLANHVQVATGFSGDGMTFGSFAGSLLARRLRGEATPYDDLFKPTRFHVEGMKGFLSENLDSMRHFVGDRLPRHHSVASLAELGPGEGMVIDRGLSKIAVCRDEQGELHAFSATCTHMMCVVQWNGTARSFDCPCHGTRYDAQGQVLEGPALKALAPVDVAALQQAAASERRGKPGAARQEPSAPPPPSP